MSILDTHIVVALSAETIERKKALSQHLRQARVVFAVDKRRDAYLHQERMVLLLGEGFVSAI